MWNFNICNENLTLRPESLLTASLKFCTRIFHPHEWWLIGLKSMSNCSIGQKEKKRLVQQLLFLNFRTALVYISAVKQRTKIDVNMKVVELNEWCYWEIKIFLESLGLPDNLKIDQQWISQLHFSLGHVNSILTLGLVRAQTQILVPTNGTVWHRFQNIPLWGSTM